MKLSVSNIAWGEDLDHQVFDLMRKYKYTGLEIAPTRIISERPYEKADAIADWAQWLWKSYNLVIPSMQSIWYGKTEKLFGSEDERKILLEYTKKAIDFASVINCKNLVFGCPRNRMLPEGADPDAAIPFFRELGNYAFEHGTVIGMEANPPIYNTNYINDTASALELIRKVDSKGFLLNLDVGTMIENQEDVRELVNQVHLINHVHISEPQLKIIKERTLHQELNKLLTGEGYDGYISVEMGKQEDISVIENTLQYMRRTFDCV